MIVEKGKKVSLYYTLYLESGAVVESTKDKQPWQFVVGKEKAVSALEDGILGMEVGETKIIEVTPASGFGVRNEELTQTVNRKMIPEDVELYEGLVLMGEKDNGDEIVVTVKSLSDDKVVFDLNHPLAGKNLKYKVEIANVE